MKCDDPTLMLDFIRGRISERKARLFAVECCRRIWHLLTDQRCRTAVEAAERFAEGLIDRSELFDAHLAASLAAEIDNDTAPLGPWRDERWMFEIQIDASAAARAAERASSRYPIGESAEQSRRLPPSRFHRGEDTAYGFAARALAHCALPLGAAGGEDVGYPAHPARTAAIASESIAQAKLIQDVLGNPFHPVEFNPEWRTSTVVALAGHIYREKAFEEMPILGDALQDAGCGEPEMIEHCLRQTEHVRGCWVLDLVLGKE